MASSNDIYTTIVSFMGQRYSLLFELMVNRDFTGVKLLISNTTDLNQPDFNGHRLLWKLARYGAPDDIIEFAIEKGAEMEHIDSHYGTTALIEAISWAHTQTAKLLISRGANLSTCCDDKYNRIFPLFCAVNWNEYDIAEFLLMHKADVHQQTSCGASALHNAAFKNNIKMVKLLLQHGANPDLKDNKGKTPLDLAEEKGFDEIYNILKDPVEPLIDPLSKLQFDSRDELKDD